MNSPRRQTSTRIYSSQNTNTGYKPSHFDDQYSAPNKRGPTPDAAAAAAVGLAAAAAAAATNSRRGETTPTTYSSSSSNTGSILCQPSHFNDQYSAATTTSIEPGQSSPGHDGTKRTAEGYTPVLKYGRKAPPPPPPPSPPPPLSSSSFTGNSDSTRGIDNHYADGNIRRKKQALTPANGCTDTAGMGAVGDYELEQAINANRCPKASTASVSRNAGTDDIGTRATAEAMTTTRDYELERLVEDRDWCDQGEGQTHHSPAAMNSYYRETAAAAATGSRDHDDVTTPYANLPQRT